MSLTLLAYKPAKKISTLLLTSLVWRSVRKLRGGDDGKRNRESMTPPLGSSYRAKPAGLCLAGFSLLRSSGQKALWESDPLVILLPSKGEVR